MILKSVEIFNYKSIKSEVIHVNNNQLCFVGANECGKSNIIQAISFLNLEKDLNSSMLNKEAGRKGMPIISGVFEIDKNLLHFFNEQLDLPKTNFQEIKNDSYLLQIKRWGNGLNQISLSLYNNSWQRSYILFDRLKNGKNKSEFLDSFFSNYYPVIELFENEDLFFEPASPEDLLGTENKFETFRRLLNIGGCDDFNELNNEDEDYAVIVKNIGNRITNIFKKHYLQDKSIEFSIVASRAGKLMLVVNDASGQIYKLSERSPGFRYYFSFLVNKLYYNKIYGKKNVIFLLDEPGANLHPKGAKDLLKTFAEVSHKNLLIYTTHNPFLVIRNNLDSLFFVNKTVADGTKINKKPYLNKYQVFRKELGILLNDSFLIGDINLLVEGATEKYALPLVFSGTTESNLEWINIYNVEGVTKMSETLNFLGPQNLKLSGIVLLDSDKEAEDEKKKKGFKKIEEVKNWGVIEINDVFPKDGKQRTFEDLFPQDLYIESFNNYCNSLDSFDTPYENFQTKEEILTPIINKLSEHYLLFFSEENRRKQSITKQDVMRIFFDIISKKNTKERTKALEKVNQLSVLIDKKIKEIENYHATEA